MIKLWAVTATVLALAASGLVPSDAAETTRVAGGSGQDTIRGKAGRDQLSGGSGKDQLSGGKGKDQLSGGSASDRCDGGTGFDVASSCEVRSRIL